MIRQVQMTLGADSIGQPLVNFLTARFNYKTRAGWLDLIRAGRLMLDGVPATPATMGRPGMVLRFEVPPEVEEPPVDIAYTIVYEDAALLVINKPGNLPCHPAGRYFNHTLWALLKEGAGYDPLFPINRLDRETSGLVIYGKTHEAAANLCQQFSSHTVEKRYAVFVEGSFPDQLHTCGFLTRDPSSAIRKRRRFYPEGEPPPESERCETHFICIKRLTGITWIEAIPRTGCCHQIRATLVSLGYPVVGDKLYGVDETFFLKFCADTLTPADRARLRLPRQALHARSLTLLHPLTRELLTFEAPLPPDLNRLACGDPVPPSRDPE